MFTFGSDPEFAIVDHKGTLKSAVGVVIGTKDDKIEIGGNSFFHDNVNVEMTIVPGVGREDTVAKFGVALRTAAEMVAPFRLITQAYGVYADEELEHIDARTVGCDPEYCAYALRMLEPPLAEIENGNNRTAGGHIHLGATKGCLVDEFNFFMVVRCLDLFLGIPALFMDHDPTSPARRQLYGKAGSHRHKPYGVEYRALSNFWLASPDLVSLTWDVCNFVIDFVQNNGHYNFWRIDQAAINDGEEVSDCIRATGGYPENEVRAAIDQFDRLTARGHLNLVRRYMPSRLYAALESYFPERHYDLYKEWSL